MLDLLLDYLFIPLIFTFAIIVLFVAGSIIYTTYQTDTHCVRWQEKTVWQDAYISYIFTGKTMIPIQHPAGFVERTECVEVK